MRKCIYFNQKYDPFNPIAQQAALIFDTQSGVKIIESGKQVDIVTSDDIEQNQNIKKIIRYIDQNVPKTMWQVYPHSYPITPRNNGGELGNILYNDSNIVVNYQIPSIQTETFQIRSTSEQKDLDIVIDWGDGTETVLNQVELLPKDQLDTSSEEGISTAVYLDGQVGDRKYICRHKYLPEQGNSTIGGKVFKVTVLGSTYYNISTVDQYNIKCRAFDHDLPVASHISNVSNYCGNCLHLLKVNFGEYNEIFNRAINWHKCFASCYNVQSIIGFKIYRQLYNCVMLFYKCLSLTETDFKLNYTSNWNRIFCNCVSLQKDINDLIGDFSFVPQGAVINVNEVFGGQNGPSGFESTKFKPKFTMNNPQAVANKLWNNPYVSWSNVKTALAFKNCSDDVLANVPTSWGGKSTVEVQGNIVQRLEKLSK